MRLVWVVIPLILFGIVGISESFAESEEQYCDEGLVLIQKISMPSLACVKSHTAEKLIERKWAVKVIEIPPVLLETDKNIYKKGETIVVTITNLINEQFHYSVGLFDPKGKPFVDCLVRSQSIPFIRINDIDSQWLELSKDCRNEPTLPGKYVVFFYSEFGNAIRSVIVEESSHYDNVDFSKTIVDDKPLDHTVLAGVPPEIIFVLNREIIYNDEGIAGIITSTSDDFLYWDVVDSDGNSVAPYYQGLSRSGDMSKWSSRELQMSSYGRDSFAMTTNILSPGEYTVLLFNENTEIKKNFTIMDSKCCRPLSVYVTSGAYLPGEGFQIYVKTAPQTPLTFNLIEPNGKITQTKQITTNEKGEIDWQSLTLSRIATPGIWTLEAKSKTSSDTISLLVVPTPYELIKKSPSSEKILASYEEELANKKSGYDVLLVSSLEPFVDDGRQYLFPKPGHKPAPTVYYDMIKYGWVNTVGFETNDYGVVTYVDESHEKYSIKLHDGHYLEDWIPSYIPNGQKLLYATTSYDPTDYWGNLNDQYFAAYNFVPTSFVIDENTTSYNLKYNMGFRVNVSYDSQGDEIEDIIEGWSDGHDERVDSYGGVRTITQNGEMFVLHDGGYYFEHEPNSVTWFIDNHTYIRASSYYYTLDELIPIIESMIDGRK